MKYSRTRQNREWLSNTAVSNFKTSEIGVKLNKQYWSSFDQKSKFYHLFQSFQKQHSKREIAERKHFCGSCVKAKFLV